jgi:uncharacterized membrane protein YcaP (DUF421 family)
MPLAPSTFESMFTMPMPIGEKIVRTIAVYLIVVVLLRIFGRRTVAQLNAFDLVVLLLISNVVQNAIIGPDNSLTGGLIGVLTLLFLNAAVVRVVRKSARLDRAFEGDTTVLVRDGQIDEHALRHLGIRQGDLKAALLQQGAEGVGDVKLAEMFPSGAIVVDLAEKARDASKLDLERVEEKIDRLAEAVTALGPRP